jgi:predicted lipoprotein with Yx(FWY)xxD motif
MKEGESAVKQKLLVALAAALAFSGVVVSATAVGGMKASASRAVVKVAFNKQLKTSIVVDGNGLTVYLFTEDTAGKATCAAADPQCPKIWPAFRTTGKPLAGKGINASLLGTTKGAGGVQQVTYNHHPLYYYKGLIAGTGDHKPGDIKGQASYGVWYVLSPKGRPIRKQ